MVLRTTSPSAMRQHSGRGMLAAVSAVATGKIQTSPMDHRVSVTGALLKGDAAFASQINNMDEVTLSPFSKGRTGRQIRDIVDRAVDILHLSVRKILAGLPTISGGLSSPVLSADGHVVARRKDWQTLSDVGSYSTAGRELTWDCHSLVDFNELPVGGRALCLARRSGMSVAKNPRSLLELLFVVRDRHGSLIGFRRGLLVIVSGAWGESERAYASGPDGNMSR